jgi:hypothetical protein
MPEQSFEEWKRDIEQRLSVTAGLHIELDRINAEWHAGAEARRIEAEKRQAEFEKRQAEFEKRQADSARELEKIKAVLRRAIRLAVREARAERTRRQEADAKHEQWILELRDSQRKTEEALRRFLGTNGHGIQN